MSETAITFDPENFTSEHAANVLNDSAEPIAQFFAFGHLPPHLQAVSRPFGELAAQMLISLPRNPERTVALRKLLESKDAAVRARVAK